MNITTVFGIIGAILMIVGLILTFAGYPKWIMLWVIAIILFGTNGIIEVCRQPTFSDVDEGKAIYQETTHIRITGNDTTSWKTYKIVWINNNK